MSRKEGMKEKCRNVCSNGDVLYSIAREGKGHCKYEMRMVVSVY